MTVSTPRSRVRLTISQTKNGKECRKIPRISWLRTLFRHLIICNSKRFSIHVFLCANYFLTIVKSNRLMKVDIRERFTIRQALMHPWMHRFGNMKSDKRKAGENPTAKRRCTDINMS